MKQFVIWISVVGLLSTAVFSGAFVRFDHFWQEWSFWLLLQPRHTTFFCGRRVRIAP
jgi:hypothetical protein